MAADGKFNELKRNNLIHSLTDAEICTFYEVLFPSPNPRGKMEATQQNCHVVLSVRRVLQSNLTLEAIT